MPREGGRGLSRSLVIHPDEESRLAVEQALRRIAEGPVAIYGASSLAEGLASVTSLDPQFVLIDLTEQRDLALDVAREARRPGRLIIGLFNPLTAQGAELDFFREAVRAGFGDFVPLPVSDPELEAAIRAAPRDPSGATPAEGRVVCFFSHKGGVGTTTLATQVAIALARRGDHKDDVALCDAAIHLGDAAAQLGLAPDRDLLGVLRDLGEVVALPNYLSEHAGSGLRILASPRDPVAAEAITPEDLGRVLIELRRRFPLVVVDTASPLDALTLAALDLADMTYIVTDSTAPTVLGTKRILTLIDHLGFRRERLRVVLNRHAGFDGSLPPATVAGHLGCSVDHVVPADPAVMTAANTGQPLILGRPRSAFAKAVGQLADDIARV